MRSLWQRLARWLVPDAALTWGWAPARYEPPPYPNFRYVVYPRDDEGEW